MTLLRALQAADSAFPGGGFAFSNGIEGWAMLGALADEAALAGLFAAVLRHRWAGCDRVVVARAWRCGADPAALRALDDALEAATLPPSLREGSRANGAALLRSHARLGSPGAAALQAAVRDGALLGHLPVVQGALWRGLGLTRPLALAVSGYTTLSTMAAAAVRLGRIGALAAQAALGAALPLVEALAAQDCPGDGDDDRADDAPDDTALAEVLSGALPWLDLACARQAAAGLRLFAN